MIILDEMPPDFESDYVRPRRPAVVRGGVATWPAIGRWTPAYLRDRHGEARIALDEGDDAAIEFSLGEYLALLEEDPDDVEPLPYLRNVFLRDALPDLVADVSPLPFAAHDWLRREPLASLVRATQPDWIDWCELFISQAGTRFPSVHVDRYATHAWCAQVFGRKRYFLWPPDDAFRATPCLGEDLASLLPHARPAQVDVGPGDLVFIPARWPHTAESLTTSITTSGNFVVESNGDEFLRAFWQGEALPRLTARRDP